MNKLLHREQLSVMFVGGPNQREDFHLEAGSEFFYQLRGDMELPIVHGGKREVIHIREGDVFLLPSCIPHSPQRPEAGSIGLVIERQRYESEPHDGLRYYVDFNRCDEVLWEQYFHCYDLGRDLVPVVNAFRQSEACRTGKPTADSVPADPPLQQDTTTLAPPPFRLSDWLNDHTEVLNGGGSLDLFEGHPDGEFSVRIVGGASKTSSVWRHETFLYQLSGSAQLHAAGESLELTEGSCTIVPAKTEYSVVRPHGSRGMVVTNDPKGNGSIAIPKR